MHLRTIVLILIILSCQLSLAQPTTIKPVITYHSNGQKKVESYYKNGKLDSVYREWTKDGRIKIEGFYNDGKRIGTWLSWDRSVGNKNLEETLYQEGKKKSGYAFMSFHDDSLNKMNEKFIEYGTVTKVKQLSWHRNGKLARERFYSGSKMDSTDTSWDEQGNLVVESRFKDGKYHGKHTNWYSNGVISRERFWVKGVLQEDIRYDEQGIITSHKKLKNGKLIEEKKPQNTTAPK